MLKRIVMVIGIVLLGISAAHSAQSVCKDEKGAACPVVLVGPNPAIINPVLCDASPQTVTYTVESEVPNAIKLDTEILTLIDDTSPDSTVDITGGTCYNTNPPSVPKEGSCTIEVTITPASCLIKSFPQNIVRELVVDPDVNQGRLIADITVEVTEGF